MSTATKTEPGRERARAFPWEFNTFEDPALRALFATVGNYAASLPDAGWLTLCGNSDAGKSHLARKLVAFWRAHCIGGPSRSNQYPFFARWITVMRSVNTGSLELIDHAARCGFLVIDDFGSESAGTSHRAEASRESILEVLDRREGKPTVLTANLSIRELESLDKRIASRLNRNGIIFESTATPYADRPDKPAPKSPPAEDYIEADDKTREQALQAFREKREEIARILSNA